LLARNLAEPFRDPDDHRLEIYCRIDQIPPGEQAHPAHEGKGAPSLEAAIADPFVGQNTSLSDPSLLTSWNRSVRALLPSGPTW
jgi:hypothetical protein